MSFLNVLPLGERPSFGSVSSSVVWLGGDAAPAVCAAVDRARKTYMVFGFPFRAECLDGLAGLGLHDFQMIAHAEYLNIIFFLILVARKYKNRLVLYMGVIRTSEHG